MTPDATTSSLAAIACIWLMGCNASAGLDKDFPATPLIRGARSDAGHFTVDLYTAPEQPPTFGSVAIQLRIVDAQLQQPIDELILHMTPVMPAMGHGTSEVPAAKPQGIGLYEFASVNLFMSGRWDLVTDIAGATSDAITLSVDVK